MRLPAKDIISAEAMKTDKAIAIIGIRPIRSDARPVNKQNGSRAICAAQPKVPKNQELAIILIARSGSAVCAVEMAPSIKAGMVKQYGRDENVFRDKFYSPDLASLVG